MDNHLTQGSPEWIAARVGSLGASCIHEAVARTKSGWGASRANLMARLISERLTGLPQDTYQTPAMLHGINTEAEARDCYVFRTDAAVETCGLFRHPTINGTHASPDGLVGSDGLLEIKCPSSSTHIDTLLEAGIPSKYVLQMQWQMACTGRAWCDFISFDPRLPESMRLYVQRVERAPAIIAELERDISGFLDELDTRVRALVAKYERRAA